MIENHADGGEKSQPLKAEQLVSPLCDQSFVPLPILEKPTAQRRYIEPNVKTVHNWSTAAAPRSLKWRILEARHRCRGADRRRNFAPETVGDNADVVLGNVAGLIWRAVKPPLPSRRWLL